MIIRTVHSRWVLLFHFPCIDLTKYQYVFKTDKNMFDWYEEPGNEYRLKRFSAAMEGAAKLDPPNAILAGKYATVQ